MTPFQAQAVLSLLGILLSGIVSTVITHRLTSKRAEREFRREKLELLFMSTQRYARVINGLGNVYLAGMAGAEIHEAMGTIFEEIKDKEDSETAWMLCNLYFHELTDYYSKIQDAKEAIDSGFSIYTGVKQATPAHGVLMQEELSKLNKAWATFNDELFKVMKRL